jgi:predicted O-methyltransferase YrrM
MSDRQTWTAVDDYFGGLFAPEDDVLVAARRDSDAAGLPPISVSPNQGSMLAWFVGLQGARTVLEVGTLGGYSTIWLARALPPGGRLLSLELNPHHAEVARANLRRAGLEDVAEVRVGDATDTLARLAEEGAGPYDLVFLDADKPGYPAYLPLILRLSGPGTLLIADNVVRRGLVADADSDDANVRGVRDFLERLAAEPGVTVTAIQSVGAKGYDGFALARVGGTRKADDTQ